MRTAALIAAVALVSCGPSPHSTATRARASAPPPRSVRLEQRPIVLDVDPAAMAPDAEVPPTARSALRAEADRRRLRESVGDLSRILGLRTGAPVTIANAETQVPDHAFILRIGTRAAAAFGPVGRTAPGGQAFRYVVRRDAAGLYGESDLATSYAIYELLDRIGCRWFLPGPLGEVLEGGPLELVLADDALAPATEYRGIWYADDAYKRRNRLGGQLVDAGHALEIRWVTADDRAKDPSLRATIGGKPHPSRLRWSSPALPRLVAERIVAEYERDREPSYSVAPDDGAEFDESPEDRALDAGDFDPTMGMPSITDRFLHLANAIATEIAPRAPDLRLGFLAYVQYTRPPRRERLHPLLVPEIAPITYARAHPLADDRVPGNRDLREAIARWADLSGRGIAVYFYGWNLAEAVAPNPMLAKWGHDVPFVLAHKARWWQPETLPNFETSIHALYMGLRLAFDPAKKPSDVYAEIDSRLYGAAGPAMHAYWQAVDRAWLETPEYSGGPFAHGRRFPEPRLRELRRLLDVAKGAARTEVERKRIELADDSLGLFEEFMRLRRDFIEGRFGNLATEGETWRSRVTALGEKWKDAYAFTRTTWAPQTYDASIYDAFQKPAYVGASAIAKTGAILGTVRHFRWWAERSPSTAESARPSTTTFSDARWPTTDVALESWSSLGLHDWFGAVWYRATLTLPRRPAGETLSVWLATVDGDVEVWVDGVRASYVREPGGPEQPRGTCTPLRFSFPAPAHHQPVTLAIRTARAGLTELGVSGLMGPVVVHGQPPR